MGSNKGAWEPEKGAWEPEKLKHRFKQLCLILMNTIEMCFLYLENAMKLFITKLEIMV